MANMAPMVSMALSEDEQYDYATPMPIDKPEFPWELRIALTEKTMEKLGLDPASAMQAMGGIVHGHFMGRVTSTSQNQQVDGDMCSRVEIQIEALAIDSEDDAPVAKKPGLLYAPN